MIDRYRALVLIGAWCGLRFGEMAELRRQDVDLKTGVVHVRRGVVRVDGQISVGDPKSSAGVRSVAIPPHLVPVLQAHLDEHVDRGRDSLIFTSVRDPTIEVHPNTLYRHWYRAREVAGRPDLRIHDLRHTGAVRASNPEVRLPLPRWISRVYGLGSRGRDRTHQPVDVRALHPDHARPRAVARQAPVSNASAQSADADARPRGRLREGLVRLPCLLLDVHTPLSGLTARLGLGLRR